MSRQAQGRKGSIKMQEIMKHHERERKVQGGIEILLAELSTKCPDIRKITKGEYKVVSYLPEQHFMTLETDTHVYSVCYRAHQLGYKGTGTYIYDFPKQQTKKTNVGYL
jgi:hypothetical protein